MARDRGGEVSKTSSMTLDRGERRRITLTLNGRERTGYCESRDLLSDFVRHELGATGTHGGCEHGVFGACTVHVDGVAAPSSLLLARRVDGRAAGTGGGVAPEQ